MKARGKREKEMTMEFFKRGFNLGADMFKARILNATAGYEYEAAAVAPDSGSTDPMSESTLGVDPRAEDSCPPPDDVTERYNQDTGHFEPASY